MLSGVYIACLMARELPGQWMGLTPNLPPRHLHFPSHWNLPCLTTPLISSQTKRRGLKFVWLIPGDAHRRMLFCKSLALPPYLSHTQKNLTMWVRKMLLQMCRGCLSYPDWKLFIFAPLNTIHPSLDSKIMEFPFASTARWGSCESIYEILVL